MNTSHGHWRITPAGPATGLGGCGGWSLSAADGARFTDSGGVDLADALRLGRAAERTGPAVLARALTERELCECRLAGDRFITEAAIRFSIKESVVKALGGLPPGGRLRDIEVGPAAGDALHRRVRLHGPVRERAAARSGEELRAGAAEWAPGLVLGWAIGTTGRS
ncbi:4'-phosphopantetheinyl transferase superfamily protein [uncultured Thermomonospora sp.]|uniref:holo-ACP synthase n=1 Tax=uncultured Thermomonospora sp. TaxID=671175 RepID=UPI00019ECF2E|nr:4'-phosphopantetheinyl transferase superfamily protein [uncultured Thermomonospora sp.]